ncbi:MAG: nucleotidyltransferase family protein [Candidatus Auribacterota bacterium]|nr:nucleotidyltransferase family protein [Candidatus Auribacterota bacterium]
MRWRGCCSPAAWKRSRPGAKPGIDPIIDPTDRSDPTDPSDKRTGMTKAKSDRPVFAIILAAGESRRFAARNKLFLPFGDKTLLEVTVGNILNSRVDGTVVVLGHQADRARALLEQYSCSTVLNPDYRKGMGSSVVKGIDFWLERIGIVPGAGFIFVLGDQPFIPEGVINSLLRSYRATGADIVVPVYNGRRGNPAILNRRYADEIREAAGRWGARDVILRHPDKILTVSVEDEGVILDIDTPEDYKTKY